MRNVTLLGTILLFAACASRPAVAEEIVYDFRGRPYDAAMFRPTGPGASMAIRPDQRGLRITLTAEHGMKPAVGIALRTGLKGDFEITLDFEIVEVEKTQSGNGAGVSLWITMVSYTQEAATIGRVQKSQGKPFYFSHRASTPVGGKREHSMGKSLPAQATTGKLRLVRTGSTLTYLAADGEADTFEVIYESELGEEDVDMVRFAADNGGSPTLVDVLIRQVTINVDDAGPPERLPPRPSRWPLWIGISAGVVLAGGGYWFWRRR